MKMKIIYMGVFFLFLSLVGCQRQTQSVSKTTYALDTIIQITLYDSQEESLIDDCFALCSEYEKKFSRTKEESEIYKLNQDGEADVSRETLELIQKGLYYSELSKGMFDITIEPVSSLWNFTVEDEDATLPNENDIKRAIKKVDYTKVKIDGNHVSFLEEGMGIDLGAIAKGYIADRLKEYLLAHEVGSAVINLGGNVLCIGKNVDGEDFSIGVQKPEKNSSEISAVLLIDDKSVVSSGTYERYITVDGVDYHHILNPKTGYSYQNGLSEVTIISNQSVDGDGLSTTCFALGIEEGIKLLNSIEDTCGMFIDESGETYYSDGFEEYIKNH